MARYQLYSDGEKVGVPEGNLDSAKRWGYAFADNALLALPSKQVALRRARSGEKKDFIEQPDGCLKLFYLGFSLMLVPL